MAHPNALFSAAAFIGFILVTSSLPWHLQAWNVGTCCYMIWVGLACLNQFVNSIIWNGNALNVAPIWCDISSRLIIGVAVAIPASSLCISRRLYKISSLQAVSSTRVERRRAMIVDLSIAVGLPILQMILQIVVEGHRFDIWQDIGCMPFTYNVTLAYPIVFLWPLVIGLISMCYSIPSIIAFRKRHSDFVQYLASSSSSSITANRYLRLMILSSTESLLTVPLAIYVIVVNATLQPIQPWISWEETHFDYGRVGQFPRVLWTGTFVEGSLESGRWMVVACALVGWAFFGTGEEAKKWYGNAGSRVLNVLRRKRNIVRVSMPSGGTLPVYIRQEVIEKRSSLDTFASVISEDLPSFKGIDLLVSGRDSTFGSTTTLGNDTTDTIMNNSTGNGVGSTGQGPRDTILDISSNLPENTRLRSDSLSRTGTPLLPAFAAPDEYSTSPSSHFALPPLPPALTRPPPLPLHIQNNGINSLKRSTTATSKASGPKSSVPGTATTNWSRSSAAISASEMFTIQRYHLEEDAPEDDEGARLGYGDGVCGLEAEGTNRAVYVDGNFPRSPTLGDRLSFLSRKTTLRRPSCKASDMPNPSLTKPLLEIKPSSTCQSFPLPPGEAIKQPSPAPTYPTAPSPPLSPSSSNSPTPSRDNTRRFPFIRPPPLSLSAPKMRRSAHSSFLDLTLSPASVSGFSTRR
ncbi:a-factor receptor [Pleurotus pulmonarius]|nr:a-factor receptor [Pleurotus pulmonarius]KAF4599597.1 a-factor receptor [Pleurotus pulmonarius]